MDFLDPEALNRAKTVSPPGLDFTDRASGSTRTRGGPPPGNKIEKTTFPCVFFEMDAVFEREWGKLRFIDL